MFDNSSESNEIRPHQPPLTDQRKLDALRDSIEVLGVVREGLNAGDNASILQGALSKLAGILEHGELIDIIYPNSQESRIFKLENRDHSADIVVINPTSGHPSIEWRHVREEERDSEKFLVGYELSFNEHKRYQDAAGELWDTGAGTGMSSQYYPRLINVYAISKQSDPFETVCTPHIVPTNFHEEYVFRPDGRILGFVSGRGRMEPGISELPLKDFLPEEMDMSSEIDLNSTTQ
ncbi:MAG TPA: hypothetical protein VG965_00215 [Patescibacteria group bacterium]|nr:hypothetical protein [Patescibacteria group bacterium]